MTEQPPPHRLSLGRRRAAALASALLALTMAAAACASAERPTLVEQGSGVATTGRGDDADREQVEAGTGSSDDQTEMASETTSSTTGPGGGEPATTAPTVDLENVQPPPDGLGAIISPAGVLVRVTGEIDGGYVVETPCGFPAVVEWGTPIGPVQVVIDPGHGGDEQGAVAETGLTEAELNLDLARRTAAELTRRSISVALTRTGDYRMPISRRAALADSLAPSAFISIHHNTPASAPSPTPGTEVFVQSASDDSHRLGGTLYQSVVAALGVFDIEWTARSDAGVLEVIDGQGEDAYGINRYPLTPSALVEMAYLGNPREAALLATDDYLDAAATALADGIERYLTTDEPGTGFIDTPRSFTPSGDTGGTDGCIDPDLG